MELDSDAFRAKSSISSLMPSGIAPLRCAKGIKEYALPFQDTSHKQLVPIPLQKVWNQLHQGSSRQGANAFAVQPLNHRKLHAFDEIVLAVVGRESQGEDEPASDVDENLALQP